MTMMMDLMIDILSLKGRAHQSRRMFGCAWFGDRVSRERPPRSVHIIIVATISQLSMSTRWQQAWDDAEPRLEGWIRRWDTPNMIPRVLRVNQLDAELLDEELVQTLKEPLAKALGLINVGRHVP